MVDSNDGALGGVGEETGKPFMLLKPLAWLGDIDPFI